MTVTVSGHALYRWCTRVWRMNMVMNVARDFLESAIPQGTGGDSVVRVRDGLCLLVGDRESGLGLGVRGVALKSLAERIVPARRGEMIRRYDVPDLLLVKYLQSTDTVGPVMEAAREEITRRLLAQPKLPVNGRVCIMERGDAISPVAVVAKHGTSVDVITLVTGPIGLMSPDQAVALRKGRQKTKRRRDIMRLDKDYEEEGEDEQFE